MIMTVRYFKKVAFIYFLLVLIISLFLITAACSPKEETVLEIEAAGAVILSCEGERASIRSYSPEMTLSVERVGGSKTLSILIENVSSEISEAVTSAPLEEENKAVLSTEIISPTEVMLHIEGGSGPQEIQLSWNEELLNSPLTFAVLGDSQGNNDVLAHMIEAINVTDASFLIYLGDMVPSGLDQEYQVFLETMKQLEMPYFTVPGNHDVRTNGLALYEQYLAPAYHSFDLLDYSLIFLNTSKLGMEARQQEWLEARLDTNKDSLLFLHVPLHDPRGKEHAFLDKKEAENLMRLIKEAPSNVRGVFSGHIHMFKHEEVEGINFVTSGGGGAHLYAAPDEGGFHHYTIISVDDEEIEVLPTPIEAPLRSLGIAVTGKKGDMELSPELLLEMAVVEKEGEVQNIHGNFRGKGVYKGVPIRNLVEKVGGMEPEDLLIVHSWDGYSQEFAYENVFPETVGWGKYQGEMILAIEYNGTPVPDWDEGYRIVFLPEDGAFDNEDYRKTSMPDKGWYLYKSAGSSWVKIVNRLEVIESQE